MVTSTKTKKTKQCSVCQKLKDTFIEGTMNAQVAPVMSQVDLDVVNEFFYVRVRLCSNCVETMHKRILSKHVPSKEEKTDDLWEAWSTATDES